MNEIIDFYENKYSEDERLKRHRLEFIRTQEIISRYLKHGKKIIDIGGATGVYSLWLAEQGFNVTLYDLVSKHIEIAKVKAEEKNIPLTCLCGDARNIPFDSEYFDVVLNMGSLYHLQEKSDRFTALYETKRVLKTGGVAICSFISRYAPLLGGFKESSVDDNRFLKILDEVLLTGRHNNNGTSYFTTAYMHTTDEIMSEMEQAGFDDIKLIGVQGFASCFNDDVIFKDKRRLELVLKYLRETESIPELSLSHHIIAVGVKHTRRTT
jgi:ubiquinone/menaquinone biosynthesis C-methylase UbiE